MRPIIRGPKVAASVSEWMPPQMIHSLTLAATHPGPHANAPEFGFPSRKDLRRPAAAHSMARMKLFCRQRKGEQVHSTDKIDFVVGRLSKSSGADIQIVDDPSISRRQMRIWVEDGGIWIEDLDSTWGTRVNGEPLEGKRQISDLDRIQIGDTIVTVSLESGNAEDNPKGDWEGCRSRTVLPGHLGGV